MTRDGEFGAARRIGNKVFLVSVLGVALIYFLIPFYWLIVASTKTNAELSSTFGLWFGSGNALWDNVVSVLTAVDGVYVTWLRNTAFYSVTAAVGAALIATLAGYAFAKFEFRGRKPLLAVILISVAVPVTILIVPLFLMLAKMQLINTPWAMILPSMVSPFGVYLMWIFAEETLPVELLEAARIDGAGEFRVFTQIALPLLAPGFVTVLLFSFVGTWNNYFLPLLVYSDSQYYPLTVGLAQWNLQATAGIGSGQLYATHAMILTGALIAIVPLTLAFLFLQRFWQSGLTFGSVKG
ncbi:MAG: carbohydrate ABC transporter permease [Actinobacteria bacterium]|nr:carbohydrate ABC transporter permease [Actinomycetota bacterium]